MSWIDDHKPEMLDFCSRFISRKSETGNEEEVQSEFLLPFLKKEMNWDEVDHFNASPKITRPNINVIKRGKGKGGSLLFNGHVDVVEVPEEQVHRWTKEPWKGTIEGDRLYGRGSTDMKGGITSALWAIKAIMDLGLEPKGTLGAELVVGEELMHHEVGSTAATKRILEKGYRFQFCIDPEPTECEIHTLSSGTVDFEILIEGKEVHSAERNLVIYPQRWKLPSGSHVGVDAISKLIDLVKIFERIERDWTHRWRHKIIGSGGYPTHEDGQGVGCFVINPSIIEGGKYIASVPGSARAHLQCYFPPWVTVEEVIGEIKKVVDSYAATDDWLKENPPKFDYGKIFSKEGWPSYNTSLDHPACEKLAIAWKSVTGAKAQFSGFKAVNDLGFLQKLGIPGVSMGPGSLHFGAHGPDEYVPISQLVKCAKTFAVFIINWCGLEE